MPDRPSCSYIKRSFSDDFVFNALGTRELLLIFCLQCKADSCNLFKLSCSSFSLKVPYKTYFAKSLALDYSKSELLGYNEVMDYYPILRLKSWVIRNTLSCVYRSYSL